MTADELRVYFGLCICMGMVRLPHHYRPRDPLHHPSIVERIQMQHSVCVECVSLLKYSQGWRSVVCAAVL